MRPTCAAPPRLKRIASAWPLIPRWSMCPAASTARVTWFFVALTCPVCVVEKRFVNCGSRRFGEKMLKRSGRESSTSVRRASLLIKLLPSCGTVLDQATKQHVKREQSDHHHDDRQVRKLRHECAAQSLTRIDQRIHQHDLLQNRKRCKRAPRIIRAAEEDHRRQHETKHQTDLRLVDAATE